MAGNILTAKVAIRGTRPLFWHAFGPDAIPLEKGERTGVAGNDPEEWRKTVLATEDGRLYIEPSYVFGCVRDGARYTKNGRGSIQSAVAATVQVVDDRIYMANRYMPKDTPPRDPEQDVYLDVRSVKNPATKGRNVRYRVAAKTGWETGFTLLWDASVVNRGQLAAVLNDAGKLVGLGDGRSIGFGRFEVESFDVMDS